MGKCIVPDTSNDRTVNAIAVGPCVAFNKSYLTNAGQSTVYVLEAEITTGRDPVPIVPTCAAVLAEGFPIPPGKEIVKESQFFGWGGFFAVSETSTGDLRWI